MAASNKIRVGIVGVSPNRGFASIAHIPALQALPKRQVYGLARRTVTTDAASSHAEKEDVPAVSIGQLK